MFETSKPNPERSGDSDQNRDRDSQREDSPAITTLEELSAWIDEQLVELERRFADFETARSLRGYYDRSNR